jgi:hypothetical protein
LRHSFSLSRGVAGLEALVLVDRGLPALRDPPGRLVLVGELHGDGGGALDEDPHGSRFGAGRPPLAGLRGSVGGDEFHGGLPGRWGGVFRR